MNSTLKTALPVVLVVLMVFGITFMSQFTAPTKPRVDTDTGEELPVLVVGNAKRHFNPTDPDVVNHYFQNYFEMGTDGKDNRVGFFVRNVRGASVFLTALAPSCSTCTSIRGAVLPHEEFQNHLRQTAAGSLWGGLPVGNLVSTISWVQTRDKLKWHDFEFNNRSNKLEIPAAASPGMESWALLELGFKMNSVGPPAAKMAWFDIYDSNGNLLKRAQPFEVDCGAREAMELFQYEFTIPELSDSNPSQTIEVVAFSAIRDRLPPPSLRANENDPYIKIGEAEALNADQLEQYSRTATAASLSGSAPAVVNYRSGYRYQVTVSREAGGKFLDMGQFSKELYVSAGAGIVLQKPLGVRIRGTVVGFIRLEGLTKIDFGSYDGNFTQKKDVRLWTERKDVEIEIVPSLTQPNFLKATLGTPTVEAGRTYWNLNVQIPEKEGKQPPWDGTVYLRTKGANPMNVRIPVSGHGR